MQRDRGTHQTVRLLLSGGIDSAASLVFLQNQGFRVETVFVDHGQPARERERIAAETIANFYDVSHEAIGFNHSSQLRAGEIPGRNSFLLFAALVTFKSSNGLMAIGVHAGTPYFDCSETYIDGVDRAIAEQTNGRVRVIAPFVTWLKSDIISYALSNNIPIDLTYSCESGDVPCHSCASCRDREQLAC